MNRLFLDTSLIIALLKGSNLNDLDRLLSAVREGRTCCNGIVLTELYSGVTGKKVEQGVMRITSALTYLSLKQKDFIDAGRLRSNLFTKGLTMSTPDALIAAQVLNNDLRLITLDKFFLKLPVEIGLKIDIPI
ncbi:MAG: PIN domain-containing protein [Fidelibacterota bacterium]